MQTDWRSAWEHAMHRLFAEQGVAILASSETMYISKIQLGDLDDC